MIPGTVTIARRPTVMTTVELGGADRVISTSESNPVELEQSRVLEDEMSALVLDGTITLGADLKLRKLLV